MRQSDADGDIVVMIVVEHRSGTLLALPPFSAHFWMHPSVHT
jgi:hypothetical protein